jgi:hypothetical protein
MPLVGHSSLVADAPHHESKCDLLGPHGSGCQQVFASAKNAALGRGMQEELGHDTDEPGFISTKCHTSENNILPSSPRSPFGSHRSLLNHQRRHSLPEQKFVSIQWLSASSPLRPCQPRLFFTPFTSTTIIVVLLLCN